jgi:hypothetical protein
MIPLMNYSDIARIMKMSIPSVVMALNQTVSGNENVEQTKFDRRSKVKDQHIQFLIS